jgi:hypothetical protein
MTKPSYPLIHDNTAGNARLPGNNTLSGCYSTCAIATTCSLTTALPLQRMKFTIVAKANKRNKKRIDINAAHTKRGTTNIGFAQHGRNAAYSLGSAFNRTIKKINKNKHVSFAANNNSVHKYINNKQPIMVTYDLEQTDTTSARRIGAKQGFSFCKHRHKRLVSPMEELAMLNTSPNSHSNNFLLKQSRQAYSRTSLFL